MAMGLSRLISRHQRARLAGGAIAVEPVAIPEATAMPGRHPRIGLWVLSSFATIAALVAISALVIGPQHTDAMVVIPLVLFWSIAVSIGFAIRSALIGAVKSISGKVLPTAKPATVQDVAAVAPSRSGGSFLSRRKPEKPDATLERLARMVRSERNREARHAHSARGLAHAG